MIPSSVRAPEVKMMKLRWVKNAPLVFFPWEGASNVLKDILGLDLLFYAAEHNSDQQLVLDRLVMTPSSPIAHGFWTCPGSPMKAEAVGLMPWDISCSGADVAVAKAVGATPLSWGKSWLHVKQWECYHCLHQSQNFSLCLCDVAESQGLAQACPSDLLHTQAGSCWLLNVLVTGTEQYWGV